MHAAETLKYPTLCHTSQSKDQLSVVTLDLLSKLNGYVRYIYLPSFENLEYRMVKYLCHETTRAHVGLSASERLRVVPIAPNHKSICRNKRNLKVNNNQMF